MKHSRILLSALAALLLASCSDDDNASQPAGSYDDGVLVLNEGTALNGSVTFIGDDMTTVYQDIFKAVNPTLSMGGYAQSIFFRGDNAYLISNGSNKVTVVNRYTFAFIATIDSGFSVPRYGAVIGNRAYVTNLGSFSDLTDDFVSVIDLDANTVVASYPVGDIAERIVAAGGKLFIGNGSYADGDSVTVMNPSNGSILATVETGLAPNSMEAENGILYVMCANFEQGKMVRIDVSNNTFINEVAFPASFTNPSNLTVEDNKIWFTDAANVYKMSQNAMVAPTEPVVADAVQTLYGFAVEDDKIFVADAKDYASNGAAKVYGLDGTLLHTFATGLIPNGFYFND